MHILYDLLWWLWLPLPSIVPWVHSPLSSHWTTTVESIGRETKFLEVSMPCSFLQCLLTNTVWCSSSLLVLISWPIYYWYYTSYLRNWTAMWQGLEGLAPVMLILFPVELCICQSWSHGVLFFMVHFMNLMQASTCLLIWWWYDDDNACSIFRPLQNFFKFFWNKIVCPHLQHFPFGYAILWKHTFKCMILNWMLIALPSS